MSLKWGISVFCVLVFIHVADKAYGNAPRFFQNSESDCSCGTREMNEESKAKAVVVNGEEVDDNSEYPWVVSIHIKNTRQCGGTLISATYTLTAAHCLHDSNCNPELEGCFYKTSDVYVGIYQMTTYIAEEKIPAVNIIVHPKYDSLLNDIALVKATKQITCTKYQRYACVSKSVQVPPDTDITILGWGMTSVETPGTTLLSGVMKTTEADKCKEHPSIDLKSVVCLTANEDGTSLCYGDSGGPAMHEWKSKWYVLGVVSTMRDNDCAVDNLVRLESVSYHYDFIERHVTDFK